MTTRTMRPLSVLMVMCACAGLISCASGPKVTKAQKAALTEFDKRTENFGEPDWVGYAARNGLRTLTTPSGIRNELAGKSFAAQNDPTNMPFETVTQYTFYYPAMKQQVVFEGNKAAREVMDEKSLQSIAEADRAAADAKKAAERAITDFKRQTN